MLTAEQLEEYDKNGVLVIENVLTDQEVELARNLLHQQLLSYDIDHDKVLAGEQQVDDVRIKGKASRIFYNKWKLDVHLHPKIYNYVKDLMHHTYETGKKSGYEHPFGKFTDILPYIDRVCWRLPDCIKAEGGLGLHLDRNPVDPYLLKVGGLKKWRPIQCFVTLTDHYGTNTGGLKVVKSFHHRIDEYFSKSDIEAGEKGEFFRMGSKSYASLAKELEPINAPKGSLVLWDNRLPHATCDKLDGYDTREVVYLGWLPDIAINKTYWKQQSEHIKHNIPPPAYLNDNKETSDKNWSENDLTVLQRRLLGI